MPIKVLLTILCIVGSANSALATATHFWDCSGGACDARTLQPWDYNKYRYAPQYAPVSPSHFPNGASYGEKIWMTAAPSDPLTKILGPDDGCCGTDPSGGGGCGKCLLVTSPTAVNKDWKVLVIKKNRCPPSSSGCNGKPHLDFAAPGYDNLQYSLANICGQGGTYISRNESAICGDWYKRGSSTIQGCSCASLPSSNQAQKRIKEGCELFTSWGWTSGNPTIEYQIVKCPTEYVHYIGSAFKANGVQPVGPLPKSSEEAREKVQ